MQNNKCDTHPGSERLQSSRAQPRRDAHSVYVLQCVKLFHRMSIHGIVVMHFLFITECTHDDYYMRSMRKLKITVNELRYRYETR